MSNTSTTTARETGAVEGLDGFGSLLRPVEAAGFWAAVVLPFVYVPVIVAGLDTQSHQIAVALLLTAHVLALLVGHRYHRT